MSYGTSLQLFEWPWRSISQECPLLSKFGYKNVLVSPPQEHAILPNNPWYERYQAVSYKLDSRGGTEDEFRAMIQTCHKYKINVYVDAIINHMSGGSTNNISLGFSGSKYNKYWYDGIYEYEDFNHCNLSPDGTVHNWNNRDEVQLCELVGLADLKTSSPKVQNTLVEYLNKLIEMGVDGFRIDAAKHIPATELKAILSKVKPHYTFHEIMEADSEPIKGSEYFDSGDVTEFRYSWGLRKTFYSGKLADLKNFGEGWGLYPSGKSIVFVDNHDSQRTNSSINFKDPKNLVLATVFMLAHPYGKPLILSSFNFNDPNQGLPIDDKGRNIPAVGVSGECLKPYVGEHRWLAIRNAVYFRDVVGNEPLINWWDNGNNQMAFGRGNKGFVVINHENTFLDSWFQTGLPEGLYCNLAKQTEIWTNFCEEAIFVNKDGWAQIKVDPQGVSFMARY